MEEDRINVLVESARDSAPLAALGATTELRQEVERMEALHVRRARAQGFTWAEIATVLGVSRQAVHKKYGGSRFER